MKLFICAKPSWQSGSIATGRTATMVGIRTNRVIATATATKVANNRRRGSVARRISTTTSGDFDCLSLSTSPRTISVNNTNRMPGQCSSRI